MGWGGRRAELMKQLTETDLYCATIMWITRVRFGKIPRWSKRIEIKCKGKPVYWFDHFGSMQQSPDVLVVEPCDKYELDFMIFPTSVSPTQTMHVRIWPKDVPRPDY